VPRPERRTTPEPPPQAADPPAPATPAAAARLAFRDRIAFSPRRDDAQRLLDELGRAERDGRDDEVAAIAARIQAM
jgi:hypothetical protein